MISKDGRWLQDLPISHHMFIDISSFPIHILQELWVHECLNTVVTLTLREAPWRPDDCGVSCPPLLHTMTQRTPRVWAYTVESVFLFSLNASKVSETPSGETFSPPPCHVSRGYSTNGEAMSGGGVTLFGCGNFVQGGDENTYPGNYCPLRLVVPLRPCKARKTDRLVTG